MEKQLLNMDRFTSDEWLTRIGDQIRNLRLRQNIDQATLAERSSISVSALRNLEAGQGATLTTLIKTLRSLERTDWLDMLAPTVSISPLQAIGRKHKKVRASKPRGKRVQS
jgi:transcriptional regulator with XRE-family HTH domain